MSLNTYPNSFIYNDIEKIEYYWKQFKPYTETPVSLEKWRSLIPFFEQISFQNCVLILLCDVMANSFVYAIDRRNVVSYDMSFYLANDGINFSLSNVHPYYLDAGLMMQQMAYEYFIGSKEEEQKIIVNFDGLYKKGNGDYMHFLQQVVCIQSNELRQPLLFLNYIHDITHLKKEKTANLIITAPTDLKLWNFNFDKHCLEDVHPLSIQEKKILSYLANGKSSKEMAKELFLSPHTIDTHRRNLLEKTNCLNTTGLVTYAKMVGLL